VSVVVGFSTRPLNPLSWLIRRVTGAKCSHAWLMFREPFFDRLMVVEATEWGVRMIDAEIFWRRNKIIRVYSIKQDLTGTVQKSGNLLGDLYDFSGLVGMGFVAAAAKWMHRKVKNPLQVRGSLFCSEFVVQVLKQAGYPNTADLDPSATSPQQVYQFLAAQLEPSVDGPVSPQACSRAI